MQRSERLPPLLPVHVLVPQPLVSEAKSAFWLDQATFFLISLLSAKLTETEPTWVCGMDGGLGWLRGPVRAGSS